MRIAIALGLLAAPAAAGEIDVDLGLQATTTGWPDDNGGGPILAATYWFQPWIGASFVGKEHYATVDDRFMSYYSFNVALRHAINDRLRIVGTLGAVHQHEESTSAIMAQPVEALFGVGDGIRHRYAGRAGTSLGLLLSSYKNGDCYLALDIDGTLFSDNRGPRWMASAGLSLGFTYDFARAAAK